MVQPTCLGILRNSPDTCEVKIRSPVAGPTRKGQPPKLADIIGRRDNSGLLPYVLCYQSLSKTRGVDIFTVIRRWRFP